MSISPRARRALAWSWPVVLGVIANSIWDLIKALWRQSPPLSREGLAQLVAFIVVAYIGFLLGRRISPEAARLKKLLLDEYVSLIGTLSAQVSSGAIVPSQAEEDHYVQKIKGDSDLVREALHIYRKRNPQRYVAAQGGRENVVERWRSRW